MSFSLLVLIHPLDIFPKRYINEYKLNDDVRKGQTIRKGGTQSQTAYVSLRLGCKRVGYGGRVAGQKRGRGRIVRAKPKLEQRKYRLRTS